MYIEKITIKNVRCFKKFEFTFNFMDGKPAWAMFLGDNATGKSTLLKSIAIGLCDESSAAGLLRESEEGYIRRGDEGNAKITIHLSENPKSKKQYRIETSIEKIFFKKGKSKKDYIERVRQKTFPNSKTFPWNNIFVCAYGAGRGTIGSGDIAGYSAINAVYNMFNYSEGLQNPELTIHRMSKNFSKKKTFDILKKLMDRIENIELTEHGVTVDGPWGYHMPLRDLADGYKSSFLWTTDFLGWALNYNPGIRNVDDINGIVLVDEIEQHLHPKWQRNIVYSLKEQFKNIQFITTTHSPLVASSVGELTSKEDNDSLVHLELGDDNEVQKYIFDNEELKSIKGLNCNQILASKAFDYQISADRKVEELLAEASRLASKRRTAEDNKKYNEFKKIMKKIFQPEDRTEFEREVEEERYQRIKSEIKTLESKLFKKNDKN